jgi:general secretion pathway protein D
MMNRLLKLTLLVFTLSLSASGQNNQAPAQPPAQAPTTIIIQTPLGPRAVEAPPAPVQVVPPQAPPVQPPPVDSQAAPAAQPAPVAQALAQDEPVPISLQFDNADIHPIIRIILDTLGVNYLVDPSVKGTVNIRTAGNLRRSDLLPILESILKINGATLIKTGTFYQVVPSAAALRQALEVQTQVPAQIPPDDQMVLQVLKMKFVGAAEIGKLLTPYLSEGANIVVPETGNILMITERRSNLRKLLDIIDIFDTSVFEGDRVRIFQVKNNLAKDLVSDLKEIFSGYALSGTSAVRFIAVDRLNSVLVMTPTASVFTEVERWLGRLDQPSQGSGLQNFVYRVKNAKARDIQNVLNQLYGSGVQVSSVYNTSTRPDQAVTPPPIQTPTTPFVQPPQPPNAPIAGANPSRSIRTIADEVNNAIIVQATSQDYAEIEKTIQQLDVLPRQVLIDAQIFEVVLDNSISLGLSATLQNRGTLPNTETAASFATPQGGGPKALTASTFALVGRTQALVAFLNASENRSRVRTLSAPSVLVSDNMSASFTVGADVPIITSSAATNAQANGSSVFAQSIQFRSTGVIMNVKPQINESGNVTLEIQQEVSQASANTTSSVSAPVIGKSAVSSTIVVQDSQTIGLGGFIRESSELASNRIPLLGRIPGVGVLFGDTRRGNIRTELIILITPHVLKTHEDADLATNELKAKLKEVQKLVN